MKTCTRASSISPSILQTPTRKENIGEKISGSPKAKKNLFLSLTTKPGIEGVIHKQPEELFVYI